MKNIVMIVAMDGELENLVNTVNNVTYTRVLWEEPYKVVDVHGSEVSFIAVLSGVGKVNAAGATQFAIDKLNPDLIVNSGVVGATAAAFDSGKVVVIDSAVNSDFDTSAIDGDEFEVPSVETFNPEHNVHKFNILYTADHFTTEKPCINGHMVEGYFDMEGYAVAQTAQRNGIPCMLVKSVTDVINSGEQDKQYDCNYVSACEVLGEKLRAVLKEL